MPILNRLGDPQNGRQGDESSPEGPKLVPGRGERPSISLAALGERVAAQFRAETEHRADILLELATEASRRALLSEVAEFVLALDAVTLTREQRAAVIDHAYRELFSFGPLDSLLADEAVTAIAVNGPGNIHVQRGMGPLERVDAAFEDRAHLADVLRRVLATQGAVLDEHTPFLEVGAVLVGRAARISVAGPPASPEYSLDIRLHPRQPLALEELAGRLAMIPPQAAVLLRAVMRAGHGLVIVGDGGLGKTTLAGALLRELPAEVVEAGGVIAVERAAELALPQGAVRRVPGQGADDDPASADFGAAVAAALAEAPAWLAVDEVRGDEAAAVWQALIGIEMAPRYLWVFRGDPRPDRLRSALSMVIRRHDQGIGFAALYNAIARRLPFVVALKRVSGAPRLAQIAVWALRESAPGDEPDNVSLELVPLLWEDSGRWLTAERPPAQALDLPPGFWGG